MLEGSQGEAVPFIWLSKTPTVDTQQILMEWFGSQQLKNPGLLMRVELRTTLGSGERGAEDLEIGVSWFYDEKMHKHKINRGSDR